MSHPERRIRYLRRPLVASCPIHRPIESAQHNIPARILATAVIVAALTLSACGDDPGLVAGTRSAPRTVEIEMRDIAFSRDTFSVQTGETVRFIFTNVGAVTHDAFLGDQAAQDDHEAEMRQMSEMDHPASAGHDAMSEGGVTAEPGTKAEITHTFVGAGDLLIGCHGKGHYAAGMRIAISTA